MKHSPVIFVLAGLATAGLRAATYEVGPDKPYASIGEAPLARLEPGDVVLIHYRPEPYREKFVLCRQGTADAPIVIRGVPGEDGTLPVLDGANAKTAPGLNFWGDERSVIKIGGASTPADTMPKHIVIENLHVRSARSAYRFTDENGNTGSYARNAAAITIEKGENITIRNCILTDSGNGLFVSSSNTHLSRDILVEGNYIHGNGNPRSSTEHNVYSSAMGVTFQYNRFGPPLAGSAGNNLKDRSAGMVIRYNWIEGGNRQLDLVDAGGVLALRNDPSYRESFVYGNVLIEPDGDGNSQITHYGGDSGNTDAYRKGMLFFYNNTIVTRRTNLTILFRLSTNDESCDFRNNIVYPAAAGGEAITLINTSGTLLLSNNWMKPGWVEASGALTGKIVDDGTTITGDSPGFVDEAAADYRLAEGSPCIDRGALLEPRALPGHEVVRQYVKHQSSEERRPRDGIDIGAYEF